MCARGSPLLFRLTVSPVPWHDLQCRARLPPNLCAASDGANRLCLSPLAERSESASLTTKDRRYSPGRPAVGVSSSTRPSHLYRPWPTTNGDAAPSASLPARAPESRSEDHLHGPVARSRDRRSREKYARCI